MTGPVTCADGKRALAGDVVRLGPDGQALSIFAESEGYPLGVDSQGRVMAVKVEQVGDRALVPYMDFYSSAGTLLARAALPDRDYRVEFKSGKEAYRIGDGCFYEIWISHDGVHVSKWVTN